MSFATGKSLPQQLNILQPNNLQAKVALKADLVTYATGAADGMICYASDEDRTYVVRNAALVEVLNGSTEVMNIGSGQIYKAADGNVGIGTTSPNVGGYARALTISANTQALVELSSTRADGTNSGLGGLVWVYETNSSGHKNVANISAISSGATANQRGGDLAFYTKPNASTTLTERMRIDSSGNVLIGKTDTSLSVAGSRISQPGGDGSPSYMWFIKTFSGTRNALLCYHSGTYVGGIDFSNTATIFVTSSDMRMKENIVDSPSVLEDLCKIKIRSFDWKHDVTHTKFGVVAQELVEHFPEAVSIGEDNEDGTAKNPWSVSLGSLVPQLIKAIQELNTKHEAESQAKDATIAALIARIEALEQA